MAMPAPFKDTTLGTVTMIACLSHHGSGFRPSLRKRFMWGPTTSTWGRNSRSLSKNWEGSRAWGLRGADKAREGGDVLHIVDDEQRSMRPQPPCALRVPAAHGHLRCCRASTMYTDIACGPAPSICPCGARNAAPLNSRTGS